MPSPNPNLHTPNLILRPAIPSDAPALAALFANPLNTQHEPHAPSTPTAAHYLAGIAKWDTLRSSGRAYFLVITRPSKPTTTTMTDTQSSPSSLSTSDDVIGFGGINEVSTDAKGKRIADVGVLIDSSEWRKGYGREAMTATLDFALRAVEEGGIGCQEVFFETLAVNLPFQGLADRMGLGTWKSVKSEGKEVEYRFSREDWQGLKSGGRVEVCE
ncbi:hypothetical protein VTL71DRAFT_8744 [Oculimacula yallundae]|uniref:N-acetyltransferase domain-containing protein n=1 Tax=Oculimacula yallundae TaxID=86028 RepID=A0ABR4CYJ3_9HELO